MKRVIAFLLLLTVPLGFLIGACRTVNALGDDVVITAQHVYGDAQRVEGVTFQTLTTCGNHMWWDTAYTAGASGATQAEFHFSQPGHGLFEMEVDWSDFSLTTTNGMGMSTSGGDGLFFEDEALGILINAVAQKTLPGESREETLLLEDYFDCYPLDYWVTFITEDYYIEEMYDPIRNTSNEALWEDETGTSYEKWIELFRFPIVSGDTMTVSVGKDETGAIREVGVNMDGEGTASVSFPAIAVKTGMYFSPVFQTWDGQSLETGEYVYGHGLYYIPFKPLGDTEGTPTWMTFDFDGLEMVYSLESSDRLVAMEVSADGQGLHLLTKEDGQYFYCLFDIASRRLLSRTGIMDTSADVSWAFFPEQELLYLIGGDRVALVRTGMDCQVEFVTDWPEEAVWVLPSAVHYADGVLYGLEPGWYENARGVCLIACDENGLGYQGYYFSNLNGQGYNSAWINLESAEFTVE